MQNSVGRSLIEGEFYRRRDNQKNNKNENDVLPLMLRLRSYRPFLTRRLKEINALASQNQFEDEKKHLICYLGIVKDYSADSLYGYDRLKAIDEHILDLVRKYPMASTFPSVSKFVDDEEEEEEGGPRSPSPGAIDTVDDICPKVIPTEKIESWNSDRGKESIGASSSFINFDSAFSRREVPQDVDMRNLNVERYDEKRVKQQNDWTLSTSNSNNNQYNDFDRRERPRTSDYSDRNEFDYNDGQYFDEKDIQRSQNQLREPHYQDEFRDFRRAQDSEKSDYYHNRDERPSDYDRRGSLNNRYSSSSGGNRTVKDYGHGQPGPDWNTQTQFGNNFIPLPETSPNKIINSTNFIQQQINLNQIGSGQSSSQIPIQNQMLNHSFSPQNFMQNPGIFNSNGHLNNNSAPHHGIINSHTHINVSIQNQQINFKPQNSNNIFNIHSQNVNPFIQNQQIPFTNSPANAFNNNNKVQQFAPKPPQFSSQHHQQLKNTNIRQSSPPIAQNQIKHNHQTAHFSYSQHSSSTNTKTSNPNPRFSEHGNDFNNARLSNNDEKERERIRINQIFKEKAANHFAPRTQTQYQHNININKSKIISTNQIIASPPVRDPRQRFKTNNTNNNIQSQAKQTSNNNNNSDNKHEHELKIEKNNKKGEESDLSTTTTSKDKKHLTPTVIKKEQESSSKSKDLEKEEKSQLKLKQKISESKPISKAQELRSQVEKEMSKFPISHIQKKASIENDKDKDQLRFNHNSQREKDSSSNNKGQSSSHKNYNKDYINDKFSNRQSHRKRERGGEKIQEKDASKNEKNVSKKDSINDKNRRSTRSEANKNDKISVVSANRKNFNNTEKVIERRESIQSSESDTIIQPPPMKFRIPKKKPPPAPEPEIKSEPLVEQKETEEAIIHKDPPSTNDSNENEQPAETTIEIIDEKLTEENHKNIQLLKDPPLEEKDKNETNQLNESELKKSTNLVSEKEEENHQKDADNEDLVKKFILSSLGDEAKNMLLDPDALKKISEALKQQLKEQLKQQIKSTEDDSDKTKEDSSKTKLDNNDIHPEVAPESSNSRGRSITKKKNTKRRSSLEKLHDALREMNFDQMMPLGPRRNCNRVEGDSTSTSTMSTISPTKNIEESKEKVINILNDSIEKKEEKEAAETKDEIVTSYAENEKSNEGHPEIDDQAVKMEVGVVDISSIKKGRKRKKSELNLKGKKRGRRAVIVETPLESSDTIKIESIDVEVVKKKRKVVIKSKKLSPRNNYSGRITRSMDKSNTEPKDSSNDSDKEEVVVVSQESSKEVDTTLATAEEDSSIPEDPISDIYDLKNFDLSQSPDITILDDVENENEIQVKPAEKPNTEELHLLNNDDDDILLDDEFKVKQEFLESIPLNAIEDILGATPFGSSDGPEQIETFDFQDSQDSQENSSEDIIMENDNNVIELTPKKRGRKKKNLLDDRSCLICPYQGKKIVSHYVHHHSGRTIPSSCMSFETFDALITHNTTQSSQLVEVELVQTTPEKIWPCVFCSLSFETLPDYYEHLTSHTGEYLYSCSICEMKFPTFSSLKNHGKKHGKPFFDNRRNVTRIFLPEYKNEKNELCVFVCGICYYLQFKSENINSHLTEYNHPVNRVISMKLFPERSVENETENNLNTFDSRVFLGSDEGKALLKDSEKGIDLKKEISSLPIEDVPHCSVNFLDKILNKLNSNISIENDKVESELEIQRACEESVDWLLNIIELKLDSIKCNYINKPTFVKVENIKLEEKNFENLAYLDREDYAVLNDFFIESSSSSESESENSDMEIDEDEIVILEENNKTQVNFNNKNNQKEIITIIIDEDKSQDTISSLTAVSEDFEKLGTINEVLNEDSTQSSHLSGSGNSPQSSVEPEIIEYDSGRATNLEGHGLYQCSNEGCKFTANSGLTFKDHLFNHCEFHIENRLYDCFHCERKIKSIPSLMEHIRVHGRQRQHCTLCDFRCCVNSELTKHMKGIHKVGLRVPKEFKDESVDEDPEVYLYPKDTVTKLVQPEHLKNNRLLYSAKVEYGPNDLELIPTTWIFPYLTHCALCSYATKVRTNLLRHLELHTLAKIDEKKFQVPTKAFVNPVPERKELMFDKMTNWAGSSHVNKEDSKEYESKMPPFVKDQFKFVCSLNTCKQITVDESMLRAHMKALHSEVQYYDCPHCLEINTSFNSPKPKISIEKIGNHLKFHGPKLYKCGHCDYIHIQARILEKHLSEKHPEKKPIHYIIRDLDCDGNIPSRRLSSDESGKSNNDRWRCGLCRYLFQNWADCSAHCLSSHKVRGQYMCNLCRFTNDSIFEISTHAEKCTLKNEKAQIMVLFSRNETIDPAEPKQEEISNVPIWKKDSKVKHIRGIFLEEDAPARKIPALSTSSSPSKSSFKTTSSNSSLNSNNSSSSKSNSLPRTTQNNPIKSIPQRASQVQLICPRCNKFKCKSTQDMTVHMYHELQYQRFVCKLCAKRYVTLFALKSHISNEHEAQYDEITHLTILPLQEKLEESVAKQISELLQKQKSMLLKEGRIVDLQLKCKHCPQSFSSYHNYKTHVLAKHIASNRYKCKYCSASYWNLGLVKSHHAKLHIDQELGYETNEQLENTLKEPLFWKQNYGIP